MILSAREYARKYAGCSTKTVIRRIQKNLLPSNHKGRKIGKGKTCDWVVEIQDLSHLKDYNITAKLKQ